MEQRKIIGLILFLAAVLIIGAVVYFVFFRVEKEEEPSEAEKKQKIIDSLTAPANTGRLPGIPDKALESLTVPEEQEQSNNPQVEGEVIRSLTAPE